MLAKAVLILYLVAIALLLLLFHITTIRTLERFEEPTTTRTLQPKSQAAREDDGSIEATCMKCMTYFQDIFILKNSTDIVPYVKQRGEFIKTFIDDYSTFAVQDLGKCPKADKELTSQDVIQCFTTRLNAMLQKCQEKSTYAECLISKTLGERILKEASMCGNSTCNLEDFKKKFMAAVDVMKKEFTDCLSAFQKSDDACVQMYSTVLDLKNGKDMSRPTDNLPPTITRAEVEEKLGDMATFAMIMT